MADVGNRFPTWRSISVEFPSTDGTASIAPINLEVILDDPMPSRFLHTGAAFGVPGKILATVVTLSSLVLVYTGFALALRRFQCWRINANPTKADDEA